MNHIISFHIAFDFSYVYRQFGSLMIWSFLHRVCGYVIQVIVLDKVWMYNKEIMTNDDNLESNLLTSSLLKRCLVYMLVQVELKMLCSSNLTLNYAAGRL